MCFRTKAVHVCMSVQCQDYHQCYVLYAVLDIVCKTASHFYKPVGFPLLKVIHKKHDPKL